MKKARKLYESSSGDRWYLIADPGGVHPSRSQSGFRRTGGA